MAASLAEIRAKLKAQEARKENSGGGDNAIYPHWNIPEDSTAVVRFLPDGGDNDFFWVERLMIKLPFNGVKGDPASKPMTVQVPCVEMWGESCPILTEVRTWFQDPSLEDMARKYWKKYSYLMQGFVRDNPIKDDDTPENPIRRFIFTRKLHDTVKSALLMEDELQELPTDYKMGLDFRITKTKQGQWPNYDTSAWARRESALTDEELSAIDKHGLHDLSSFLPKKPTDVELQVIKEMFEASVDGEAYDKERFGAYYRPYGVEAPAGSNNQEAKADKPAPKVESKTEEPKAKVEDDEPPFDADEPTEEKVQAPKEETKKSTDDILAMIRNRQKS